MTDKPLFDATALKAAVANFNRSMVDLAVTMAVQNAMGAVWRGDLDRARTELRKLPPARRRDVAISAMSLSSLAETSAKEDPAP